MVEWSEQHQLIRDALRRFVEAEIAPQVEALEHGDLPPYEILRKMFRTFGLDELARARFHAQMQRDRSDAEPREGGERRGDAAAMSLLAIIELCRHCPGLVTAMGVSVGLAASAILAKGTRAQKQRWALDLLTFDKIGAWAITEPDSGSDAFGSMKSTAKRDGQGGYVLNGTKTFITNGPYADTIVFLCKLDEPGQRSFARSEAEPSEDRSGVAPAADRPVLTFVLDRGMPGLTQSKPLRKMGLHSSPTGELFLQDVRAGADRLLGESEAAQSRAGAKATFAIERTAVAAMALGIVERCLELSLAYARERVQFGRPIGEFQLIQDKLARMEVARMNLQNLVFRQIELAAAGRTPPPAEASAMKLYAARAAVEVALEAVQVYGGNGYMAEYRVEQLARDAKVLQIYAGTDEIQISTIARALIAG
jgi:alkylation response protein AidB-like acyl-CoA dehydrogenase